MAQKTLVILEDDTDGTKADETVRFALDGTTYELDLSEANAKKLRGALEPWVKAARRTGGRRSSSSASRNGNGHAEVDLKAVRAWAASNGVELSNRGRVPAKVIEQYKAAGN